MLENKWASHNPLIHDANDDMRLILTRYDCFKRTNRITTDYICYNERWILFQFKCSYITAALCHPRITWQSICIQMLSLLHFQIQTEIFQWIFIFRRISFISNFSTIFSTYWTRWFEIFKNGIKLLVTKMSKKRVSILLCVFYSE